MTPTKSKAPTSKHLLKLKHLTLSVELPLVAMECIATYQYSQFRRSNRSQWRLKRAHHPKAAIPVAVAIVVVEAGLEEVVVKPQLISASPEWHPRVVQSLQVVDPTVPLSGMDHLEQAMEGASLQCRSNKFIVITVTPMSLLMLCKVCDMFGKEWEELSTGGCPNEVAVHDRGKGRTCRYMCSEKIAIKLQRQI